MKMLPIPKEDVAQWLEPLSFNPKTLQAGFDPLEEQCEGQCFCPSRSAGVYVPIVCVRHAPKCVRWLKIPYPCVVND